MVIGVGTGITGDAVGDKVGNGVGLFVGLMVGLDVGDVVGSSVPTTTDGDGLVSLRHSLQPSPMQSPQMMLVHTSAAFMLSHLQQLTLVHCPAAFLILHLQLWAHGSTPFHPGTSAAGVARTAERREQRISNFIVLRAGFSRLQ